MAVKRIYTKNHCFKIGAPSNDGAVVIEMHEMGHSMPNIRAVEKQLGPRGDSQNWTPFRKIPAATPFSLQENKGNALLGTC